MANQNSEHSYVFLGAGHVRSERKTWTVIALCSVMMAVEIIGGSVFGSVALVADGLHMSTHAGALLIAALAYTYARRHATDSRFTFVTGKLGDLAGFTSAIVLAMIALLIGYESVSRFTAMAVTPVSMKTKYGVLRRRRVCCYSKCLKTACRRVSGCAVKTVWRRHLSSWRSCDCPAGMECGFMMSCSSSTTVVTFMAAFMPRRTRTTTCAPRWSMSWLTLPFLCW